MIAAKLLDQRRREGIELLDADDGARRRSRASRALHQIVSDLAGAQDQARDLRPGGDRRSGRNCASSQRRWNVESGPNCADVDTARLWRSSDFGVMMMSGLRNCALHLPAQHVEILRRRGEVADLHVVLGAELQEALEPGAECSGPWPS